MTNSRLDYLPFIDSRVDSFCPAPFCQMILYLSGKVTPCYMLRDYVLGNLKEQSLAEIWEGEPIKKLREEMLTGNHVTCNECQAQRKCHYHLERFIPFLSYSHTVSPSLLRLDLRLNSLCNLKCLMCKTWQDQEEGFRDNYPWPDFAKNLPRNLKELNLYGGEPFIHQSTKELIKVYSPLNPECLWIFSTNLNFDMNFIEDSLLHARIGMIHTSLDSLEQSTYEKIRRGGNFQLAKGNLHKLIAFREKYTETYNESFRLVTSLCAQKLNWKEIPQFLKFCEEQNIEPLIQFVFAPDELSLLNFSVDEREQVIASLLDQTPEKFQHLLYPVLSPLKMSL